MMSFLETAPVGLIFGLAVLCYGIVALTGLLIRRPWRTTSAPGYRDPSGFIPETRERLERVTLMTGRGSAETRLTAAPTLADHVPRPHHIAVQPPVPMQQTAWQDPGLASIMAPFASDPVPAYAPPVPQNPMMMLINPVVLPHYQMTLVMRAHLGQLPAGQAQALAGLLEHGTIPPYPPQRAPDAQVLTEPAQPQPARVADAAQPQRAERRVAAASGRGLAVVPIDAIAPDKPANSTAAVPGMSLESILRQVA